MSGVEFGSRRKGPIDDYARYLEMRIQELETEVEFLRNEVNYYKKEIEKLLSTPLIEGVLLETLPDGKAVVKSSTGPNLVVEVMGNVDLRNARPGSRVVLNQKGSAVIGLLPSLEDPYVRAMEVIERPNVRYSDVGGLKEQIRELSEVVELPLKNPGLFREIGIEPPKGVLLYGPPGCGKTLLAKAVAGESNATFVSLVSSELAQKFVGEGARMVREIFSFARKKAPAIILIDELDAIGAKRLDVGTSGEREIHRTLTQLLAELDGFDPLGDVKVLATTNRVDILDPALLRPGRFDRLIEVPLPNVKGRVEIFRIHTDRMKVKDVDLEELAKLTEGASGADIKAICTEAGFIALRSNRNYVVMQDFIEAIRKTLKDRFRPYAEEVGRTQDRRIPPVV